MKCTACGKVCRDFKECAGGCRHREAGAAAYCSYGCQSADWSNHKADCLEELGEIGGEIFTEAQANRQRTLLEARDQSQYRVYDVRSRLGVRNSLGNQEQRTMVAVTRVVTEAGFRPVFLNTDGTIKGPDQLVCKRIRCPEEFVKSGQELWCWRCTERPAVPAMGSVGVAVETGAFDELLRVPDEPRPPSPVPGPRPRSPDRSTIFPGFPGIIVGPGRRPPQPRPRQPPKPPPRSPQPPPRRNIPIFPGIVVRVALQEDAESGDEELSENFT
jgi:hypothetical protein